MIIVRAKNDDTGEVWEIDSDHCETLCHCSNGVQILHEAIHIFEGFFEGTDNEFDEIEVVAQ